MKPVKNCKPCMSPEEHYMLSFAQVHSVSSQKSDQQTAAEQIGFPTLMALAKPSATPAYFRVRAV